MRTSQFFVQTVNKKPTDAEIISHKLMIRAGLIRKLASGIYAYLLRGLKVLRQVEAVIRQVTKLANYRLLKYSGIHLDSSNTIGVNDIIMRVFI